MIYILLPIFCLIIILVWSQIAAKNEQRKKQLVDEAIRQKRQEEVRKNKRDFILKRIDFIKKANNQFYSLLNFENGYLSNYQFESWRKVNLNHYNEIKDINHELIGLTSDQVIIVSQFKEFYLSGFIMKQIRNNDFIDNELKNYSVFFDSIENRKLDKQQRLAIIKDEDNNIVIAGAGSGKTTTIVGKVHYLIDKYKVNPSEILVISFTKKSSNTLDERIKIKGIEVKTFHKFGLDVISECLDKKPNIFDDNQFEIFINKTFKELTRDREYLKLVTNYFTHLMKPVKSQFEFKNQGEYIQYLKDNNFSTYKLKQMVVKGKTTFKMEVVKSIEECKIANFLLFHNVEYEYEKPYEFDTATKSYQQYKPDFTIIHGSKKIYLEHFAIDKNGDVPDFFAKEGESKIIARQKYWEKIHWARNLHLSKGTILIESKSFEMNEGSLESNLRRNLEAHGVKLIPKSPEEIWDIISKAAKDEINFFIRLLGTFLVLLKSNNLKLSDLNKKIDSLIITSPKHRDKAFLEIFKPIYDSYQNHLSNRNEIDFSDMINLASKFIERGDYKTKYKYILIDEFQDISMGRYELIRSLKKVNPHSRLFVVGDDWQSIYRFTGSDISLFKNFEQFFGVSEKSKIETTYRFSNPIIKLSSDFIQKNPNQEQKILKSGLSMRILNKKTEYEIIHSDSDDLDVTVTLKIIFDDLIRKYSDIEKKSIMILGRYSFDFNRIQNENNIFNINKEDYSIKYTIKTNLNEVKSINAFFLTVHKSKGLEADIVIIINCNSGKHGFPSEMSDDPILNLVLSETDQFPNGEERRLFYVALTRAKEFVYLVTHNIYKSKFIYELEESDSKLDNSKKCPYCKTATLILKKEGKSINGDRYKFFGCSNYIYGCDFSFSEWG
jgi:DNA helicase-4